MSNRLDQERENELEPKRMAYAMFELLNLGYVPVSPDGKKIFFTHKEETVVLYVYSGWHTGKSIVDGRGILKLLKQLKS